MDQFRPGCNSRWCHLTQATIQVSGLPRFQMIIAHPLFPTLFGKLMFLVLSTPTMQELLVQPGCLIAGLVQSRDTSLLSWFHQGLSGASEITELAQGRGRGSGCSTTTTQKHITEGAWKKVCESDRKPKGNRFSNFIPKIKENEC